MMTETITKPKLSQTQQVYNYLLTHPKGLTGAEAYALGFGMHLHSRVPEIEALGVKIDREWMECNGKRFLRYFIIKKPVQTKMDI